MKTKQTTFVIAICATICAMASGTSFAGAIKRYTDHNRINFSTTKYERAGGQEESPDASSPNSELTYMVLPWGANCTTTAQDQACEATSLPECQQEHPDDENNKWRPFDIFISHDGGKTYPGYPNNPDQTKVCLNTVALNAPARPPLDPQLAFREATKLVPKGKWHPQPNGQAVVNKPVIVTVDTNRDQNFSPFTLLGYRVELKARIGSYSWDFGDGSGTTAGWPGQEFDPAVGGCTVADCSNYVNHPYHHPGDYPIQLTLHWKADYRVDGGDWQRVPGQITTTSPAQSITLLNARSELVAGG